MSKRKEIWASKNREYEIRAADDDQAEVLIYGDIGESWYGEGVAAKDFVKELAKLDVGNIDARINSYGGSVAEGLAIYNALKRHRANVTVIVEGVAVSIASLIAMAGDTIAMAGNTMMMIHAPWGFASGNSVDMRDMADVLDKYADAMASSYASKSGKDISEIHDLLKDGDDHWYTADEAVAAGFADQISDELPIAAHLNAGRFNLPARATQQDQAMKKITNPQAGGTKPAAPAAPAAAAPVVPDIPAAPAAPAAAAPQPTSAEVVSLEHQRIQARNADIRARFQPFAGQDGVQAVLDTCIDDPTITADQAGKRLLAKLGEGTVPLSGGGRVEHGADATDKFRDGVSAALLARSGVGKTDAGNEFRGLTLSDIAAQSIRNHGGDVRGMTRSEIASRVLASHTISDFPYLLENTANKMLQAAYEAFPNTYQAWCEIGEVPDFKPNSRLRLGSFNSLAVIPEGDEYKQGTVGEEKETITAATKGRYIQLTRQMIVNDDLAGFARLARMLGNAAGRTVNADAYGILNANAVISDGTALFHADHNNLAGSGAAISVAALSAARSAMRKQRAPGGNTTEYLNIMPSYLLVPVGLEDHARTVISSENNTDTSGSRKRNPIRDWGNLEVVSDPVLDAASANAWYLAADAMMAPLVEVAFLDGQRTPHVSSEEEFITDAIRWKVRMEYAVGAIDHRGGYKNAGA